jgi:hypothetical protein
MNRRITKPKDPNAQETFEFSSSTNPIVRAGEGSRFETYLGFGAWRLELLTPRAGFFTTTTP